MNEQKFIIDELKSRLNMNSTNSSKPPSTDGYLKPSPKSRRIKSGKKPGKQPGNRGHYLAQVENPDAVIEHIPDKCIGCGKDLTNVETNGMIVRQVFELPTLNLNVTEHIAKKKICDCGTTNIGAFPIEATSYACYGPMLKAFVCYLSTRQHIPVERICELLKDSYNAPVSAGSVVEMINEGALGLNDFLIKVKQLLKDSNVVHADETGLRVESSLHWTHALSTDNLTLYDLNKKRGKDAMDDLGVLGSLNGTLVHDCWKPYFKYDNVSHGLCNVHIARELTAAKETSQKWASKMTQLLTDTYYLVQEAKSNNKSSLESDQLTTINKDYKKILKIAHKENPEVVDSVKRRGRRKRSKTYNLLLRLETYQQEVLRFATDFNVPFDNNLCERDIRMVKIAQKISGGFRTTAGAKAFLAFRSYLSTATKQEVNQLWALQQLFFNKPWMPNTLPSDP